MAQKEATEEAQEEQEDALLQVLQALLQVLQAKEAAEVEFPQREAAKKKTSPLCRLWTRNLRLGWGA